MELDEFELMIGVLQPRKEHVLRSIAAVGGPSYAAFAPVGAAQRPESAEAPGRPDHDGDSDDAATKAGQVSSRSIDLQA
ncbi:MAG TPA: hypothetical protein VED41_12340 [Solirubrobacteraceae bacterium]|nr:hypothetical protein [Solirubrobacteraceae bacterium]